MKSRFGFVSNSSSTSFFCPICEKRNEFIGDVEPLEVDMFSCERGHDFHIDCLPPKLKEALCSNPNIENLEKIPAKFCPICNLDLVLRSSILEYIAVTSDLSMYVNEIIRKFHSLAELNEFIRGQSDET